MHIVSLLALAALACEAEVTPAGGANAGGSGAGGDLAAGGEASGGEAAGGSAPLTPCEAYCAASAGCDPNPDCVASCIQGTSDACSAAWQPYTACLAQTYDSVSCAWHFHECEPEAAAVGDCLNSDVCLSQCEATAGGCDCTHACIGTDFGWDCTVEGDTVSCACSHDGVYTHDCSEVTGSCDTLLYAACCLSD